MAKKATVAKTDKDKTIIKQARDCLTKFEDRESDNILRAKEAIEFRAGQQWPDQIRRDRENPSQKGGARPCPVMDKTNQYVRQIINEERQNKAAIKIRPVDDHADKQVAEIMTGIVRHIEDASEALVAYTTAGEHAIDGGFGYFRILSEYTDPMSFDQDIRIKRIHNRFSVAPGPHVEADGSDMTEALIWEDIELDTFKEEYPKAKEVDFSSGDDWSSKDTIRIGEYFRIELEPTTIHLFSDGTVLTEEEAKEQGLEGIDTRDTVIKKVRWYKVNGQEILDEQELVGQYIPIVKVTGNELTMPDGKIRVWGAIEEGMDPQRLHNYAQAGFIEHVALAPRAPWVAANSQIEEYEEDYENANTQPIAVLKYDPVEDSTGHLLPQPQRTPPPGMSMGWQQMIQNTEHGIEAAFGMYGASVGAQSQERSGIALQEQKAQGMIGNFHFPDNLSRSIQHAGRIMLEWIPPYYDNERIARILGEDGEEATAQLNPSQKEAVLPIMDITGKEVGKSYNIHLGKYDVTVSTGPSYTAKRQEAAEMQLQIVQARPELMEVIGDILFKNMDFPGADDISDRLKVLLPEVIQKMEESGDDPKVQIAMAQVEQAAAMIEQKGQALAEIEAKMQEKAATLDNQEVKLEGINKDIDSRRSVFVAEIKTQKANMELLGRRLLDSIEDVTDPIALKLAEKVPETVEESNQQEEIMGALAQMTADGQNQLAATLSDALEKVGEAMRQAAEIGAGPRETILKYDDNGEPVSTISNPIQGP